MSTEAFQVHCNACQIKTWHEPLATFNERDEADDGEIWEDNVYQILRCRGCLAVSFMKRSYFSEDVDVRRKNGEWEQFTPSTDTVFPPRLARPVPRWLQDIGDLEVRAVLEEVYIALQNGALRLATSGIRTALERTMINSVGDHGTFGGNLTAFVSAGYLPAGLQSAFEQVLDTGSASAHRAFEPGDDTIAHLLDAVENMLWQVFILPGKPARLRLLRPPGP